MRKIRIISFVLAILMGIGMFSACGNSNSDVPAGMKLLESDVVDYKLYIPESWKQDVSTGTVSAYASDTDLSNISMMAFELDNLQMTLDEYWEANERDFIDTFSDMEYISQSNTLLGGVAAKKYNYYATVTGNKYEFLQVTCIYAGVVYIFTYTAFADNFDAHYDDVSAMLEHFTFNFTPTQTKAEETADAAESIADTTAVTDTGTTTAA